MAVTKVSGAELRNTGQIVLDKPTNANIAASIAIALAALADVVDKLDRMENDGR